MVTTIVIAHAFCASPDTRISYCQCLLIQGYFCAEIYPEKVGLSKYSWYPKRKLGVIIIKMISAQHSSNNGKNWQKLTYQKILLAWCYAAKCNNRPKM